MVWVQSKLSVRLLVNLGMADIHWSLASEPAGEVHSRMIGRDEEFHTSEVSPVSYTHLTLPTPS